METLSGWWFGTFGLFFHILGRIIPADFHIFQKGGSTTNQMIYGIILPVDFHMFQDC